MLIYPDKSTARCSGLFSYFPLSESLAGAIIDGMPMTQVDLDHYMSTLSGWGGGMGSIAYYSTYGVGGQSFNNGIHYTGYDHIGGQGGYWTKVENSGYTPGGWDNEIQAYTMGAPNIVEQWISTPTYLTQGGGIKTLTFNGTYLNVINPDGNVVYSTTATSGNGIFMNQPSAQNIQNKGPIPTGDYYLSNTNWKSQSTIRQMYNIIRGNGDWGDYNVSLIPITYTGPRNSFYLHGGFFPGSAGCIDAGGNIKYIYNLIYDQRYTILKVEY